MTPFHVCRDISGFDTNYFLENSLMIPQPNIGGGVLVTDLAPTELAIWLERINGVIYEYQISVNTWDTNTPFGYYWFTDQSGGTPYSLSALSPLVHTVAYNSDQPDIIRVQILPIYGAPGSWGSAPVCTNAVNVAADVSPDPEC